MKADIYEGLRYWTIIITEFKTPYSFPCPVDLMWNAGYFFTREYPELVKKRVAEFITVHIGEENIKEVKKPIYTKIGSFRFSHGEEFAKKLARFIVKRGKKGMSLGTYRVPEWRMSKS